MRKTNFLMKRLIKVSMAGLVMGGGSYYKISTIHSTTAIVIIER